VEASALGPRRDQPGACSDPVGVTRCRARRLAPRRSSRCAWPELHPRGSRGARERRLHARPRGREPPAASSRARGRQLPRAARTEDARARAVRSGAARARTVTHRPQQSSPQARWAASPNGAKRRAVPPTPSDIACPRARQRAQPRLSAGSATGAWWALRGRQAQLAGEPPTGAWSYGAVDEWCSRPPGSSPALVCPSQRIREPRGGPSGRTPPAGQPPSRAPRHRQPMLPTLSATRAGAGRSWLLAPLR
jgi:hypothetical protein